MDFGLNKIKIAGDREKARCYIGQAVSQMNILINQMSFQNLTQGWRRLWLNENVYIECGKVFNHQECRIWHRPLSFEEVGIESSIPIHFYVRLIARREGEYSSDDRIIIWKIRNQLEGKSIPERNPSDDYIDRGFYIDGTEWGIIEEGEVILDVDVNIPPTTPEEELQFNLALKYIEQIDENRNPENIAPQYLEREYLIDPMLYAQKCSDYNSVDNKPAVSVGLAETFSGDYLPREYPHIYNGSSKPSQADCDDPEHTYNDHTWPLILESQDYYPRSMRSAITTDVCTVTGPTIFWPLSETTVTFGTHQNKGTLSKGYLDGYAYTTKAGDPEKPEEGIPCFFIGLYGTTEPTTVITRGVVGILFPDYDHDYPYRLQRRPPLRYNDVMPCANDGETGWGSELGWLDWYQSGRNLMEIVTPFETITLAEFMTGMVSPCNNQLVRELNSSMTGASSSSIQFYGSLRDPYQLSPQAILPDYPGTIEGYASIWVSQYEESFLIDIVMHEGSGEEKNWMSMFIFHNSQSTRLGTQDPYGSLQSWACDRSHLDDPDVIDYLYGYSVGVIIYILSPLAFQWEDIDTGELEFFDIHQKRDANTNRLNSNRALGLEEYINEILQDYCELPSSKYSTGRYKKLIDEYDIHFGYVYHI